MNVGLPMTNLSTWMFVHKETAEQWKSRSGKSSWNKQGHAWINHWQSDGYPPVRQEAKELFPWERTTYAAKFDNQSDYVLKELRSTQVVELETKIQRMEEMVKSERWKELKEFVSESK